MRKDYNQQFDHLIPEVSKLVFEFYLIEMAKRLPQGEDLDTSPLLNVSISVFVSTLINVLDFIKSTTIGEVKLMQNIELSKTTLMNALKSMPFVQGIEEHN